MKKRHQLITKNKSCMWAACFCMLLLVSVTNSYAQVIPERRDPDKYDNPDRTFGYGVFPAYISLPGAGSAFAVIVLANNIAKTPIGAFATYVQGDTLQGGVASITKIPVVPKYLFIDFVKGQFNKTRIQTYNQRGMDSDKEDYSILQFRDQDFSALRTTLSFWQRRIELYYVYYSFSAQLDSFVDKEGNELANAESSSRRSSNASLLGADFDFTDDRSDPRLGLLTGVQFNQQKAEDSQSAVYDRIELNFTGYVPVMTSSTIAFNYFSSSSIVRSEGETNTAVLREKSELQCDQESDPSKKADCEAKIAAFINQSAKANKYGTAASLGGPFRLRSYPTGRFSAGNSAFAGVEFRWNFLNEDKPFDVFFARDVRTTLQWAFFYETGTVAEKRNDLWQKTAYSLGTGFRIVTASGFIYRFDIAVGEEGREVSVFIDYPWSSLGA